MIVTGGKKKSGRSVGRPPKKKSIVNDIPFEGVVDKPSFNADNIEDTYEIEMVYTNPTMFKKIANLFRQLTCKEFLIIFNPTNINIVTIDGPKTAPIIMEIKGNKLNRYYCAKTTKMGIKIDHFNKIIQLIDNETSLIKFLVPQSILDKKIRIILHKPVISMDKIFDLEISYVPEFPEKLFDDIQYEKEYPITYTIPSKIFKKDINDCSALTNEIKIEKLGEGKLLYSYNNINDKINHKSIFGKDDAIKLISKVQPNEYFTVTFEVKNIKLIANSLVSDYITISYHAYKKIIINCLLDVELEDGKFPIQGTETCIIKLLVDTCK